VSLKREPIAYFHKENIVKRELNRTRINPSCATSYNVFIFVLNCAVINYSVQIVQLLYVHKA